MSVLDVDIMCVEPSGAKVTAVTNPLPVVEASKQKMECVKSEKKMVIVRARQKNKEREVRSKCAI